MRLGHEASRNNPQRGWKKYAIRRRTMASLVSCGSIATKAARLYPFEPYRLNSALLNRNVTILPARFVLFGSVTLLGYWLDTLAERLSKNFLSALRKM